MKKIFLIIAFVLTFLAGAAGGIKVTQIAIVVALQEELKVSRLRSARRVSYGDYNRDRERRYSYGR